MPEVSKQPSPLKKLLSAFFSLKAKGLLTEKTSDCGISNWKVVVSQTTVFVNGNPFTGTVYY